MNFEEILRRTKSILNSFIELLLLRNGAQSLPHTLDLLRFQILKSIKAFKGKSVHCLGGNFATFPIFPINRAKIFEKNVPQAE